MRGSQNTGFLTIWITPHKRRRDYDHEDLRNHSTLGDSSGMLRSSQGQEIMDLFKTLNEAA